MSPVSDCAKYQRVSSCSYIGTASAENQAEHDQDYENGGPHLARSPHGCLSLGTFRNRAIGCLLAVTRPLPNVAHGGRRISGAVKGFHSEAAKASLSN